MKENIILTGFMGCGKSSTAIVLSYTLKQSVIDTDQWIEKHTKRTISQIFAEDGEEAFRHMETECLRQLIKECDHRIIATGGGLPVTPENHALLRQLGTVFYLKLFAEEVYKRLKDDRTRPLLQVEDPLTRIRELLAAREQAYEATADYCIEVTGKNKEDIVQEIVRRTKYEAANNKRSKS